MFYKVVLFIIIWPERQCDGAMGQRGLFGRIWPERQRRQSDQAEGSVWKNMIRARKETRRWGGGVCLGEYDQSEKGDKATGRGVGLEEYDH